MIAIGIYRNVNHLALGYTLGLGGFTVINP